jgi:hypothetical protein
MDRTRRVTAALRGFALAGGLALLVTGCATGAGTGPGGDGSGSSGASSSATASSGQPSASGSPSTSPDPSLSLESPASPPTSAGSGGSATLAPAGTVAADLTVTLDETGSGTTTTWHLTCGPDGGDHPDPAGACAALAAAGGAAAFTPPRADVACTEQYGGPQTAHVEGTVAGARVNADFSRTNGCGISRWDPLAPLLGSAGGV